MHGQEKISVAYDGSERESSPSDEDPHDVRFHLLQFKSTINHINILFFILGQLFY